MEEKKKKNAKKKIKYKNLHMYVILYKIGVILVVRASHGLPHYLFIFISFGKKN
jgi:hypothetical protein